MAEVISNQQPFVASANGTQARREGKLICDRSDVYFQVPKDYIRSPSDRPMLNDVALSQSIPVIDLADLSGPGRKSLVRKIRSACEEDGFFQIINHGVPEAIITNILKVAKEFFTMPAEFRQQYYSDDPSRIVRISTSFNIQKEHVLNWRDFLRLHCYPLEDYMASWPSQPPAFREVVGNYCTEIRSLVLRLLAAISESLGLEPDFMDKALGRHAQHMAINYYPKCPSPEVTFGLPGHSDPNVLTLLLQGDVSGLQVLKNGQWVAVEPIPNAFVVNVGDQLQVLSNGIYKSVIHRAVVNSSQARISIPTFYCPSPEAIIQPASPLTGSDNPALYGQYSYEEYYQHFWSKGLEGKTCLTNFSTNDDGNHRIENHRSRRKKHYEEKEG